MDRNTSGVSAVVDWFVALLAEGVDRNSTMHGTGSWKIRVALLAEGVDRNCMTKSSDTPMRWSPSSRRAWIEIADFCGDGNAEVVALLAEGVDRNSIDQAAIIRMTVALLAEGVDRNESS